MSSTIHGPDLSLNRDQEELLRTALSSNPRASPRGSSFTTNTVAKQSPKTNGATANGAMANGATIFTSPTQEVPGSASLEDFDESPLLDYELEDGNFDWDNSGDQLFGDLPGGENDDDDGEHHDKRKASIDGDDEKTSSKRREGGEKSAKKPGRKPLQGEPTTKRKAQNRAAQRAFRERKERHLKDLETKVDDLEKSSEAANHENGRLRAQVEKLNTEVKEYRKRLSSNSVGGASPPLANPQARNFYNSGDFQFAFPKFGDLPSSFMSNGSMAKTSSSSQVGQQPSASSSNPILPGMMRRESSTSVSAKSPTNTSKTFDPSPANGFVNGNTTDNNIGFKGASFEDLNGLFSPSILESASRSNSVEYPFFNSGNSASTSVKNGTTSNFLNGQAQKPHTQQQHSSTSITTSPMSSMSPIALDSSCGTTPESSADSPDNRKNSEGTLNTISEETNTQKKPETSVNGFKMPGSDINGIDWMAQQNGGTFDPVLFGDYRDSQDNVLNNSFEDFFNDAFAPSIDFTSPYNTGEPVDPPQKRNLMDEIEVQQNGGPEGDDFINDADPKQFLTCDKLWDRVQASEKIQSGAADMDELCSQLKAKAKCSGSGAVIKQKDVDQILGPAPTERQDFLKMFS